MIEIIRDHPGAIGLLPLLEPETRMRVASLNGVSPTREAVENGTYPLWVDVLAIAPEEPAGPLRDFLQWLQETKPYDK
jgi:ABC-type phosphate transport system substrate-binding protein